MGSSLRRLKMKRLKKNTESNQIKSKNMVKECISFFAPLLIAYILLTKVIFISVILSGSMEPTLKVGNTAFFDRLAYINSEPQRGDVIVFYSEEYGECFGKRIIGVPGDHISFKDGRVLINSEYLNESAYLETDMRTDGYREFNVPDGYYIVMGDNREYSCDSRHWKKPYISKESIKGKYIWQIDFSIKYDILRNPQ